VIQLWTLSSLTDLTGCSIFVNFLLTLYGLVALSVVYILNSEGISVDVYIDDFYGAECTASSEQAFQRLNSLFDELGIDKLIKMVNFKLGNEM